MATVTHSGGFGWRKPPSSSFSFFSCDIISFFAGVLFASLFLCAVFPFSNLLSIPNPTSKSLNPCNCNRDNPPRFNLRLDPPALTFYDDPKFGYTMETQIKNWDEKRREWLKQHPTFEPGSDERIFIVTGSQSAPCQSPTGDHLLLRLYRNKVDYSRIHGYDIFYNNVYLHPGMHTFWSKLPPVKAAMLAHPEAEWIWWLDEDTVFTDMEFKVPLEKYKDRNIVVYGWPDDVYEKKDWIGLNSGCVLIRNCQWSLDLLEKWADMGPQSPNHEKWNDVVESIFKYKYTEQPALAYLYLQEKIRNQTKTWIENSYFFGGFWLSIMESLDDVTESYVEMERSSAGLRRRHAEKVAESYAEAREPLLKDFGIWSGKKRRRPFITHFNGCKPCSGKNNPEFSGCFESMVKALNFADNQVLRNYGFFRRNLSDSSTVSPLPFDYPAASDRE